MRHYPESPGHLPQIPGAGSGDRAPPAASGAPGERVGDERNSRHDRQVRRPHRLMAESRGSHGPLGHRPCCLAGSGAVVPAGSLPAAHRSSDLLPQAAVPTPRWGYSRQAIRRPANCARLRSPSSETGPGAETPRVPDLRSGVGRPPLRAGAAHPLARSAVSLPRSSPRLPRQGAHAPRPLPFFFHERNARSPSVPLSGPPCRLRAANARIPPPILICNHCAGQYLTRSVADREARGHRPGTARVAASV